MIDQVNSRELFVAACGGRHQPRRSWFDRLDTVVDEHLTAAGVDHDGRAAVSRQALDALRDIGAFGVQISIEEGGLGFDDAAACLVVERVAQACASTAAILMFHYQVVRRTLGHAAEPNRSTDLRAFAGGSAIASSAWTEEGAGADKSNLRTALTPHHGGLRLTGEKTFCTGATSADIFHVLAGLRRDGGGPTFVRVEAKEHGVHVSEPYRLLGLRASGTASITLDRIDLTEADLVGPAGGGPMLMAANHEVCLNPGLLALGLAYAALNTILERAPLVSDSVRDTLTRRLVELEATYAYAARAVGSLDPHVALVASGKMKMLATATAERVTSDALRVAGSRAFRCDLPLERYFRDARATSLMGPADVVIQKRIVGALEKAGGE